MYEEIYALMDEIVQLLIQFMNDDMTYFSAHMQQIWLILFLVSFLILLLVFILGGSFFIGKLHKSYCGTKLTLSLLSMNMIQENSYIQNYIVQQMNEKKKE